MSIEIDHDDLHKFRNVSELNERAEEEGGRGYIEGKVKFNGIPNGAAIDIITLSLVK